MMSIYEKKNYGRSRAYKAEAVFPIMYFKVEAVIGKRFSNIIYTFQSLEKCLWQISF